MPARASLPGAAILALAAASFAGSPSRPAMAADPPSRRSSPIVVADPAVFIWGAIAFSPRTGDHGFFWGGATQAEAREIAIEHCVNAGGVGCTIVSDFMSFRDNSASYAHRPLPTCGALAVARDAVGTPLRWGASAATSRSDAEARSLQRCGRRDCTIKEWVCT